MKAIISQILRGGGRTLSYLAAAIFAFALTASSASASLYPTETVDGKNWSYFPMSGCVEIQSAPVSLSGDVVVPATLGGLPVVGIRPYAFQGLSGITSVTLPDAVKEIGAYAFAGLGDLTAVYLPWGLETIGERAFYGCGIERLYLPGTITYVGPYAFENNTSLERVSFGSGMTAIGDYMFNNCTSLKQLEIPKTIEKVGVKPFVGNKLAYRGESTAVEPDNGIYIEYSDAGTDYLGRSSICSKIRAQHPEIKFVSYLNGETGENYYADGVRLFAYETSNVNVNFSGLNKDLPYGKAAGASLPVREPGDDVVFAGWYDGTLELAFDTIVTDKFAGRSFTPVFYAPSTIDINDVTWKYSLHEKYVEIVGYDGTLPNEVVVPSEIASRPVKVIAKEAFSSCNVETVHLPPTLKVIGKLAFKDCINLKRVALPWGLEAIGEGAFYGCNNLVGMSIPGTVTEIGESTFAECTNLVGMTIGYGVTSLPKYFLYNATSLAVLEVPKTLTSVGEACFYCDSNAGKEFQLYCVLDERDESRNDDFDRIDAMLAENNPDVAGKGATRPVQYRLHPGSAVRVKFGTAEVELEYGRPLSIDMPKYPTNGGTVFLGWFGADGREVDEDAIPAATGDYEARWVDALESEEVTDSRGHKQTWSYVSHGGYAEIRGIEITSINNVLEIPGTLGGEPVKVIGQSAVAGKDSVRYVAIPDSVTTIRQYAFAYNRNLQHVVMPASLRNIGGWAFAGCSSLIEINIPGGVASIGTAAFSECDLVDVTLPGSLKYAGEDIFFRNGRLERCTLLNGIEEIPSMLTDDCTSFWAIVIPKSVKKAGPYAFAFALNAPRKVVVCDTAEEKSRVKEMLLRDLGSSFYPIEDDVEFEVGAAETVICKFTSGDAETSVEKTVAVGSNLALQVPAPQERPGYTFLGWQRRFAVDTGLMPFVPVTAPIEYSAKYEAQSCKVVFRWEGVAGEDEERKITAGGRVGELPEIGERSGYTFGGWFTSPNGGGSQVTPDTIVAGDANYYPNWIYDTTIYRLVFDAGEGEGSFELMRSYNERIGDYLRTPTRTGYTFLGWYDQANDGYVTPDTVATGAATYTARWQRKGGYVVQFMDGSNVIGAKSNLNYGDTLGELPVPVQDGYTFAGWFYNGEQATPDTKVLGNVTYGAMWQANGKVLTLDYNTPNGQTYQRVAAPGSLITGYDLSPVRREGYTFLGWFTERVGGTEATTGTPINWDVTYYAHWRINNHKVTLDLGGGTITGNANANYDYGTPVEILDQVPVRNGAEFLGWFTEDGVRVNGSITQPDADVTYYARWKEFYKWTYSSYAGGAEIVNADGSSAWIGGEMPETLVIPSKFDNYDVKVIGRGAFMGCSFSEVVIPDGVMRIGYGAFSGCWALEKITIPSTVTTIDMAAFNGTSSLADVYVEFGYADYYKEMLKRAGADVDYISFHESEKPSPFQRNITTDEFVGMQYIIDGYDAKLVSVTSVPVGETDLEIPMYLDDGTKPCKYRVTAIGTNAFLSSSLTNITIHSSVTDIEAGAFTALFEHEVTVKVDSTDEKTRIQGLLTGSGHGLMNVTFTAPLQTFKVTFDTNGGYFDGWGVQPVYGTYCYVEEGDSIGDFMPTTDPVRKGMKFEGWFTESVGGDEVATNYEPTGDMTVYAHWSLVIGWKYSISYWDNSVTITGYDVEGELPSEVVIPDTIDDLPLKAIGWAAFQNATTLESVVLPESLESIGSEAFKGCTALKSITIPVGVTSVDYRAFEGCTALESVTIEPGIGDRTIEMQAFKDCVNLESIEIPSGVALSEYGVFQGCAKLADENGFVVVGGMLHDYVGNATAIVIPDTVADICMEAFSNRTGLKSVEFPVGLKTIGDMAFFGCTDLGAIELPEGLVSIGQGAFYGCTGVASVSIPDSVTTVGLGAFDPSVCDTTTIPNVALLDGWIVIVDMETIPETLDLRGVRGIPEGLFGNSSVKEIQLSKDIRHIGSGNFPNSLETIRVPYGEYDRVYALVRSVDSSKDFGLIVVEAVPPSIVGARDAVVLESEDGNGYDIYPGAQEGPVEVAIPEGVAAGNVTVVLPPTATVKPNGAKVKVVNGANDVTEFLDIPAANASGVIDLNNATVKEAIVKEVLDPTKDGVSIDLDPSDPEITTAKTRPGLTYTFSEGTTLEGMTQKASKVGDGTSWKPTITVKGGTSGFYSIGVTK